MELENYLEEKIGSRNSTIARDLKLNLLKLMTEGALEQKEAYLALLAIAAAVEERGLVTLAAAKLKELDYTSEQIDEAKDSAGMMAMLNVYYRFRHMVQTGQGSEALEPYKTAGLRMTALARPALGKERYEMLAFAVSVLNGCESCINSHEQALRQGGVEPTKIHDLARLTAVVKGVKALSTI